MAQPRILVLRAPGTNCDSETAFAFERAGGKVELLHVNRLLESPSLIGDFQILCLPGGFSYGDDIAAGRILGNQIRHHLASQLQEFKAASKLILGICNGFQLLVKLGLIPSLSGDHTQETTLTFNDSGRFEDRWVYLKINEQSPCVFTRGLARLYLPVRHGEGKFVTRDGVVLKELRARNLIVAQYADERGAEPVMDYPLNPNGSVDAIAGICDATGRVFGMMPHAEAFLHRTNHPRWTRERLPEEGQGVALFRNAVEFLRSEK